ncbi:MAG: translation initiation factor IF-3 [Candidatus Hydrogenedentota bacterium]|nr:MAG: translation initiation factor IF-3 [Candidatus Hydrogenedentota bacterium]
MKDNIRINEEIEARELRLVGPDSEQLGIVTREEALMKARATGLDLCEIAPNARPPVCKLMDFGKFRYDRQKKLREAKRRQKVIHVKEVKFSPMIDDHDFEIKVNHVLRFLEGGDKVKVTMTFRGRQVARPELGRQIIARLIERVNDKAQIDRPERREGNRLTVVLSPKS